MVDPKRFTTVALSTLFLLLFLPGAMADNVFTGDKLLETCESSLAAHSGICAGYITGVAAGSALMRELDGKPGHCRPAGIPNSRLVEAAVIFLQNHPEASREHAELLVFNALSAAWPCKE